MPSKYSLQAGIPAGYTSGELSYRRAYLFLKSLDLETTALENAEAERVLAVRKDWFFVEEELVLKAAETQKESQGESQKVESYTNIETNKTVPFEEANSTIKEIAENGNKDGKRTWVKELVQDVNAPSTHAEKPFLRETKTGKIFNRPEGDNTFDPKYYQPIAQSELSPQEIQSAGEAKGVVAKVVAVATEKKEVGISRSGKTVTAAPQEGTGIKADDLEKLVLLLDKSSAKDGYSRTTNKDGVVTLVFKTVERAEKFATAAEKLTEGYLAGAFQASRHFTVIPPKSQTTKDSPTMHSYLATLGITEKMTEDILGNSQFVINGKIKSALSLVFEGVGDLVIDAKGNANLKDVLALKSTANLQDPLEALATKDFLGAIFDQTDEEKLMGLFGVTNSHRFQGMITAYANAFRAVVLDAPSKDTSEELKNKYLKQNKDFAQNEGNEHFAAFTTKGETLEVTTARESALDSLAKGEFSTAAGLKILLKKLAATCPDQKLPQLKDSTGKNSPLGIKATLDGITEIANKDHSGTSLESGVKNFSNFLMASLSAAKNESHAEVVKECTKPGMLQFLASKVHKLDGELASPALLLSAASQAHRLVGKSDFTIYGSDQEGTKKLLMEGRTAEDKQKGSGRKFFLAAQLQRTLNNGIRTSDAFAKFATGSSKVTRQTEGELDTQLASISGSLASEVGASLARIYAQTGSNNNRVHFVLPEGVHGATPTDALDLKEKMLQDMSDVITREIDSLTDKLFEGKVPKDDVEEKALKENKTALKQFIGRSVGSKMKNVRAIIRADGEGSCYACLGSVFENFAIFTMLSEHKDGLSNLDFTSDSADLAKELGIPHSDLGFGDTLSFTDSKKKRRNIFVTSDNNGYGDILEFDTGTTEDGEVGFQAHEVKTSIGKVATPHMNQTSRVQKILAALSRPVRVCDTLTHHFDYGLGTNSCVMANTVNHTGSPEFSDNGAAPNSSTAGKNVIPGYVKRTEPQKHLVRSSIISPKAKPKPPPVDPEVEAARKAEEKAAKEQAKVAKALAAKEKAEKAATEKAAAADPGASPVTTTQVTTPGKKKR